MPGSRPELLLVRGAPGVGKSSAVARLRRHLPKGAIIEVDALRGMIAAVEWSNKQQHMLALDHALLVSESFLERGFRPVVIIDTLGKSRLEAFLPLLTRSYAIVSLYAHPERLTERVTARPEGQFKDLQACHLLNEEMARYRYPQERFIDTSEMRPGQVAHILLDELGGESA